MQHSLGLFRTAQQCQMQSDVLEVLGRTWRDHNVRLGVSGLREHAGAQGEHEASGAWRSSSHEMQWGARQNSQ